MIIIVLYAMPVLSSLFYNNMGICSLNFKSLFPQTVFNNFITYEYAIIKLV